MKKIFIVLPILLIIILSGYEKYNFLDNNKVFKIPISTQISIYNLDDPMNVTNAGAYDVLTNLNSPLITVNNENEITSNVASKVVFHGKKILFYFDDSSKTSKGNLLTAKDAYLSIMRTLEHNKKKFMDLSYFICPDYGKTSKSCKGIKYDQNTLEFELLDSKFKDFAFQLLSSIEYSIIPMSSVDWNHPNKKIIDYTNTTGAYYLSKDNVNGEWVLFANKYFKLYNKKMPQIVEFIQTGFPNYLSALKQKKTDIIPTYYRDINKLELQKLKDTGFNVRENIVNTLHTIFFTPQSLKKFSIDERKYIVNEIKSSYCKNLITLNEKCTDRFFLPRHEGFVNTNSTPQKYMGVGHIKSLNKEVEFIENIIGRPLDLQAIRVNLKNFKSYSIDGNILQLGLDERKDAYSYEFEMPVAESLSELVFYFQSGLFHLPGLNPNQWLTNYVNSKDKNSRISILKKLHLELLNQLIVAPVSNLSLMTITSEHWKNNNSNIKPDLELWNFTYE